MNTLMRGTLWGLGLLSAAAMFSTTEAFEFECRGDQAKCAMPGCSGDETACNRLIVFQYGVDKETGAHVVLRFDVEPEHKPQSMELTLTLGEQLSDCSGGARDVSANANNGEQRSIDGFLCHLRATWTRY